jgi:hypothetical protein
VSGGFRKAEDVAVRILDVEIALAPGPQVEGPDDGSTTTDELVVQLLDSGDGQECVEVLLGPPMRALGLKLRCAFEMNHRAIARHAGVEILVDEIAVEAEALLVESQCVV